MYIFYYIEVRYYIVLLISIVICYMVCLEYYEMLVTEMFHTICICILYIIFIF